MTRTTKVVGATVTLLALLVLGVSVLPASHDQGALTGAWRFTVRLPDSERSTVRFVLQQDGEVLTGTYSGSYGTQPITGTVTLLRDDRSRCTAVTPGCMLPVSHERVSHDGAQHDREVSNG